MEDSFMTRVYLYKIVSTNGEQSFELIDKSDPIPNDNANYFEKDGGYIYFGWKKTTPKIFNFEGIVNDVKIYTDTAFIEESSLKGILCEYNEYG